jgi:prepilin-type N-terminal cleavage/methylation domain-containing protein
MNGNRRVVRGAFTLLELLVVITIVGVMLGLLLAAVQKARAAAARLRCQNNLKQLSLALHQHAGDHRVLPPGFRSPSNADRMPYSGWTISILPYLEQSSLHQRVLAAYAAQLSPFQPPRTPG